MTDSSQCTPAPHHHTCRCDSCLKAAEAAYDAAFEAANSTHKQQAESDATAFGMSHVDSDTPWSAFTQAGVDHAERNTRDVGFKAVSKHRGCSVDHLPAVDDLTGIERDIFWGAVDGVRAAYRDAFETAAGNWAAWGELEEDEENTLIARIRATGLDAIIASMHVRDAFLELERDPYRALPKIEKALCDAALPADLRIRYKVERSRMLRKIGYDRDEAKTLIASYAPQNDRGSLIDTGGKLILRSANPAEIDMRIKYVVDRMIPAGEVGLVSGPWGTGKTWLLLHLALCVAYGLTFFGHSVQQRPVFYVATEGMRGVFARVAGWLTHHGLLEGSPTHADLHDRLKGHFHLAARPIQLDHADLEPILRDTIEVTGAGIMFIDTANKSLGAGQSESSNDDIGALMGTLENVAADTDCTILLAHHLGHQDKTRSRGASAWEDGAGFVYIIKGLAEDFEDGRAVTLLPRKMKNDSLPRPIDYRLRSIHDVTLDGTRLSSAVLEQVERTVAVPLSLTTRIIAFIDSNPGCTARELRAVSGANTELQAHKDRLCRLGIVADRGKGNSHQYHMADGWRAIAEREGVDYPDPLDLGTSVAGEEEVSI